MKRLWVILAGAALVLWLALAQSRPGAPSDAPHAADAAGTDLAGTEPVVATAPAAASTMRPTPTPAAVPTVAPALPLPAPTPPANAGPTPVSESDLIPLPAPRDKTPHFTAAQARAGSPGKILGRAFAREKPDPEWSPGAEADIHKVIDKFDLAKRGLLAVECRSSVCKLQMRYSLHDRDQFDGIFGKLHDHFRTNLGFEPVAQMDSHGQQLVRVYVMREGKTLHDYAP